MSNPVNWFEIYVDDMERARTFYETVLNLSLTRLEGPELEMWAFPMEQDQAGASGALVKLPGYPAGNNGVVVYFSSEDCAIPASRAVEAGGRIDREKMSVGQYGYIALVIDTEGNTIGLHSMQ